MLKLPESAQPLKQPYQPPSGGCVLKLLLLKLCPMTKKPAAFGRLCVETRAGCSENVAVIPAAFGRLCVETTSVSLVPSSDTPAAFGRLCVETEQVLSTHNLFSQPPSGGCVLKQQSQTSFSSCQNQPPSGGCVLKPDIGGSVEVTKNPAAFGRLCVETLGIVVPIRPAHASRLRAAVC